MSDRFENRNDLASKIMWEGGLTESLDYGLRAKDMPEGDEELIAAWTALDEAWAAFKQRAAVVEKLVPDLDEE